MVSAYTYVTDAGDDDLAEDAAEELWLQLCQMVVQVHTGFNSSQVSSFGHVL